MQINILNGIFTDGGPDFRTSYPVNYVPVPKESGISQGYLRPASGIVQQAIAPGIDRGGINWNGICHRVLGSKLCTVPLLGNVTVLGDVGPGGQCTFDYSFDRLGIRSDGRFYYWDGTTLTQVTDPDLGNVVDFIWIDGHFMTTDGEHLVVTELNDPFAVDPLKFASSEVDPDPVVGLLKLQDEAYALNRHTIEVFENIGGEGFPFQRIEGAQIEKGVVGTYSACVFGQFIAFVGSGRNEAVSIYLGYHSVAQKISTREIDVILQQFSEAELALIVVEQKVDKNHQTLLVHLPDRTLCYDAAASAVMEVPVWYCLTSALDGYAQYRARNLVRCYDKWLVGDTQIGRVGFLDDTISSHWGESVRWEFGTMIAYNEGRGAQFHELELVALTGSVPLGEDPMIETSYTFDGETWSQSKAIRAGTQGQRAKRLVWLQQGPMGNWRIQRFRGDSGAHFAVARLEAQIEALAVGF